MLYSKHLWSISRTSGRKNDFQFRHEIRYFHLLLHFFRGHLYPLPFPIGFATTFWERREIVSLCHLLRLCNYLFLTYVHLCIVSASLGEFFYHQHISQDYHSTHVNYFHWTPSPDQNRMTLYFGGFEPSSYHLTPEIRQQISYLKKWSIQWY